MLIAKNGFDQWQAKLETGVWALLVGDYVLRGTGKTPGGKYACFERGNTSRFMEVPPILYR